MILECAIIVGGAARPGKAWHSKAWQGKARQYLKRIVTPVAVRFLFERSA